MGICIDDMTPGSSYSKNLFSIHDFLAKQLMRLQHETNMAAEQTGQLADLQLLRHVRT